MIALIADTVKLLELGSSPHGYTRYALRAGEHRQNSFVKADLDAAGGGVFDVLNKLPETQQFGIALMESDTSAPLFCDSTPPLRFVHNLLPKSKVARGGFISHSPRRALQNGAPIW
jgi:hypothetical protein